MALIKCPDCGREISDMSEVCIYCGRPIRQMPINNQQINNNQKNHKEVYITNCKKGKTAILTGWILMLVTVFPILDVIMNYDVYSSTNTLGMSNSPNGVMIVLCILGFIIGLLSVIVGTFIKWWHN